MHVCTSVASVIVLLVTATVAQDDAGQNMMPGISVLPSSGSGASSAEGEPAAYTRDQRTRGSARSGRLRGGSSTSRIVFPDLTQMYAKPSEGFMSLPDDMDMDSMDIRTLTMMDTLNTAEDFAMAMGLDLPEEEELPFGSLDSSTVRFGGNSGSVIEPIQAHCIPENTTVELDLPTEAKVMYFPKCVRLPRCNGCCTNSKVSCMPSDTITRTFKVMKVAQTTSRRAPPPSGRSGRRRNRRQATSYYHVNEVEHVACACMCRLQARHCIPGKQSYDGGSCACNCNNKDERSKCVNLSDTHYWHKDSCTCKCNKEENCSTTQFFDHGSCSCVSKLTKPGLTGEGNINPRVSFADDSISRGTVDNHIRRRET